MRGAADLRVGSFRLLGTASTAVDLMIVWPSGTTLGAVQLTLNGITYGAITAGETANFADLPVPAAIGAYPMDLLVDGVLVARGEMSVSAVGTATPTSEVTVRVADGTINITTLGIPGPPGPAGPAGPAGGIQSIVAGANVTVDDTDPANPVVSAAGGGTGGGAVDSVNGQTGDVVLGAGDVGADISGAAALALSDAEDYADQAIANLNLGSAANEDVSFFATAAQGATADTAVQPAAIEDFITAYVWDGTAYQPAPNRREFTGPVDPTTQGFTMLDGDKWVEP